MARLPAYGSVVDCLIDGARIVKKFVGLAPPIVNPFQIADNAIPYPISDFGFLSPINHHDIASIKRIPAEEHSSTLDGIVDLEGRGHLFYVRLTDGSEVFAKPYRSADERDVLERLHQSGVTTLIGINDNYFVERKPVARPIEDILGSGTSTLREIAGLLGEALYAVHSAGVVYGERFNGHVFADPIAREIRISNFSSSMLAQNPSERRGDIIRALKYIESLAAYDTILKFYAETGKSGPNRKRFEGARPRYFYDAVVSFISNYVVNGDDQGRATLMDALRQIASGEEKKGMLVMASNRFLDYIDNSQAAQKDKGKKHD